MKNAPEAVHPTQDSLAAFGLGKTDEQTSTIISQHLERCASCRSRVAGLSGDSFVERLKSIKASSSTASSASSLHTPDPDDAPRVSWQGIPSELSNCGQYEEVRELGKGGMGIVYVARNKLLGRNEVLKVVNRSMLERPGSVERFLREIQSAARLHHPNVVTAYSAFQLGELLVFAMEYIPGSDLAQVVRKAGTPPVANACYYALQAAQGLQHAYEKGMVHRDIKPSNLILTKDGAKSVVKILDFGLSKMGSEKKVDTGLTGDGRILGTPDYMAPEQAMDATRADIRADIYSLGCTLFFLLTGRPPFAANSLLQLLQLHQSAAAPALNQHRQDVPPELAGVVARMMAKEPRMRYQTPAEVAKALLPFVKRSTNAKPSPESSLSGEKQPRQPDTRKSHPTLSPNLFSALPAEFGRYRVLKLLGQGGMGAVYLADDTQLGRQVALKLPFFDAAESPQRVERFIREGRAAAILHHRNICTVYDSGQHDGKPFITMAFIDGAPLDRLLHDDVQMPQRQAAGYARKIALALAHAHGKGTVHRDLKPANVMIDAEGEPVVMDFGLAKRTAHQEAGEGKLTRRGSVLGTPTYMSPEQVKGETELIGPATDIFSLGVILFEMLTNQAPYSGSMVEVMGQILAAPTPWVKELRPDVDPRLETICRKAMAKEPQSRFRSMEEFAAALEEFLQPSVSGPAEETDVELEVVAPVALSTVENSPFGDLTKPATRATAKKEKKQTSDLETANRTELETANRRTWWKYGGFALGIVAFVLLVFAAKSVFKVKTPDGVLVIEVSEPNAEIFVDGARVTVAWDGGGKKAEIHAKPGTKKVEVRKDGFKAFGEEVTLEDGGRLIVLARLEKEKPIGPEGSKPAAVKSEIGFIPPKPISPSAELEALKRAQISPEALALAGNGDAGRAPECLVGCLGEVVPIQRDSIWALAYSPDSRWLASGSPDQTIMLREADTGDIKRVIKGHESAITGLVFSKDSRTLLSCSPDGTIRFWNVDKEDEPTILRPEMGEVWSMAASPDGRFLAAGGNDRPIKLWKWGEWDKPVELEADKGRARSLSFSADGEQLASSWDGRVRIYQTSTGKVTQSWPFEESNRVVAFHKDGKILATAGGVVKLWEIATRKQLGFVGGAGQMNAVALHPSGKFMYCCENNGVGGWLRDIPSCKPSLDKDGNEMKHFHEPYGVMGAAFSPDGNYLAFGTNNASVHVWDFSKNRKQLPKQGHNHFVKMVAVSPNGRTVLTGGDDNAVLQWDIARRESRLMDKANYVLNHISYSPDGTKYITSASSGDQVSDSGIVWDAATGNRLFTLNPTVKCFQPVFSPDGKVVAGFNAFTGCIHLWDARTGKQLHIFPRIGYCNDPPAFSADGRLMTAAAHDTQTVKIWEVESGDERLSWVEPEMLRVALSPNGRLLATANTAGAISLWDLAVKGKKIRTWSGHTGCIDRLKFTPDGKTLVSSGEDGTIRLWNPDAGRARETISLGPINFMGPTRRLLTFDIDPSGKYLFAAGSFPVIFILRLPEIPAEPEKVEAKDIPRPEQRFVPLFNGKDLTGWSTLDGGKANWKTTDGAMTCAGPQSHLYTDRADYGNFHLRVEVRVNATGNSGIYFRADKPVAGVGDYEAQVCTRADQQKTGSLYGLAPTNDVLVEPDTWFTYEIIVVGDRIRMLVNGKETVNYTETRPGRPRTGRIVLQHHDPQTSVFFRKIEIEEFPDAIDPKKQVSSAIEPQENLAPDRRAAEYLLSIGGTVRANDEVDDISSEDAESPAQR